jgi:hypothetical protein
MDNRLYEPGMGHRWRLSCGIYPSTGSDVGLMDDMIWLDASKVDTKSPPSMYYEMK